jgi:hypothetical protein
LAVSSRLPTVSGIRDMAELGDLMSYGVDFPDLFRRAATHVDISKHVGRVNRESMVIDEMAA